MTLIDKEIAKGILTISSTVLKDHFFYDEDGLKRFSKEFALSINCEHMLLQINSSREFRDKMKKSRIARTEFTTYFVGYHLCKLLFERMNFSGPEIDAFETILIKYIKVCETDDNKQVSKRKNAREPSSPLYDL